MTLNVHTFHHYTACPCGHCLAVPKPSMYTELTQHNVINCNNCKLVRVSGSAYLWLSAQILYTPYRVWSIQLITLFIAKNNNKVVVYSKRISTVVIVEQFDSVLMQGDLIMLYRTQKFNLMVPYHLNYANQNQIFLTEQWHTLVYKFIL